MTDFAVDRAGLRSAAGTYDNGKQQLDSISSVIQNPDPMMLGLFLAPAWGVIGPLISQGSQGLIKGVGDMLSAYATNLPTSANTYEEAEEQGAEDASTIVEV